MNRNSVSIVGWMKVGSLIMTVGQLHDRRVHKFEKLAIARVYIFCYTFKLSFLFLIKIVEMRPWLSSR